MAARLVHPAIRRRRFMAGAAGGALLLGLKAGKAQAATSQITAVMHSDLRVTDPIITTAYIVRNHGYMVYDTLLGTDADFKVQPQMASFAVSDDRLTYTFTLREGLRWHDGAPVTAEDCVASLRRWGARDGMGQKLMQYTGTLDAPDARTIRLVLKEPYGLVLDSIGKPSSVVPFMMPARLAQTPPTEPIKEQVGSGPFRFVAGEFQPGVRAVYEKFQDYVPRGEPASWTAGGKRVHVDRVVWVTMPDAQTAIDALLNGEIDYLEQPQIDLLPLLEGQDVTLRVQNRLGLQALARMNFLYPPFDQLKARQAAFLAINQKDVLDALIGDPNYYRTCGAVFGCDTPFADDAGSKTLLDGSGVGQARALLQESGYDGRPVVILHPTDVKTTAAQPVVVADAMRKVGFNVDLQATDWQSVVIRRASQKPPAEGGWNIFCTNWVGADILNPISNVSVNTSGKDAWFGWPTDPEIEAWRDAFARATDSAKRTNLAQKIQARVMEQVIYIPLGQYTQPAAWSPMLKNVLDGPAPVFWNITKEA